MLNSNQAKLLDFAEMAENQLKEIEESIPRTPPQKLKDESPAKFSAEVKEVDDILSSEQRAINHVAGQVNRFIRALLSIFNPNHFGAVRKSA